MYSALLQRHDSANLILQSASSELTPSIAQILASALKPTRAVYAILELPNSMHVYLSGFVKFPDSQILDNGKQHYL